MSGNKSKVPVNDWRRQGQESYLLQAALRLQDYSKYREGWDHDHCEFCGVIFSEAEGGMKSGYATDDRYRWICVPCFEDFREEFGWTVET
jgi:hypothetical protein